jgi:hypothetical protein
MFAVLDGLSASRALDHGRTDLPPRHHGRAQYSYRVAWRDPSGVQKYKTFRTKKEAEAFEAEIIRAKNRGLYVDPHAGKQLFSDYAAK